MKTVRTFSFEDERDSELLAWLDRQANKSETVRTALNQLRGQPSLELSLSRLRGDIAEIKQLARRGQLDSDSGGHDLAEADSALLTALDGLGL